MYRTHNCGELRQSNCGEKVRLSGWVNKVRDKGHLLWIDLRDRYGITQLFLEEKEENEELLLQARELGREYVIQVAGEVIERASKNPNIPTGDIEVRLKSITVLNESIVPPFTIEENTDGGEELRMKYRYLDLRRKPMQEKILLRHELLQASRKSLSGMGFLEIETPNLIKSTPEGARDFVVPSRMHPGSFYALPQSPQTFKQLLMVGGYDKYFQIVRCFRDEDLRADRQPEFTQIDCEMSFVGRDEIMQTFEKFIRDLFLEVKGVELKDIPVLSYATAMERYGSDKPDMRFGMEFNDLTELCQNKGFRVFDAAESILGIVAQGCAAYTRKQLDKLTAWVQRPQIGAKGLVYLKCNEDGSYKSSVDKFFDQTQLSLWAKQCNAKAGDLILILAGQLDHTRNALSELRLELGSQLGLRSEQDYKALWVVDFPLLEYDEESKRWHAMHHPFTAPHVDDKHLLASDPGKARATAYDMVINGMECGGGSVRIHDKALQEKMFGLLGFSKEEAQEQFGFLMEAFQYGAPPHGGIAFGFDRLCTVLGGGTSIRDYIAFPKNNAGRDLMIDSPSLLDLEQLDELGLALNDSEKA